METLTMKKTTFAAVSAFLAFLLIAVPIASATTYTEFTSYAPLANLPGSGHSVVVSEVRFSAYGTEKDNQFGANAFTRGSWNFISSPRVTRPMATGSPTSPSVSRCCPTGCCSTQIEGTRRSDVGGAMRASRASSVERAPCTPRHARRQAESRSPWAW